MAKKKKVSLHEKLETIVAETWKMHGYQVERNVEYLGGEMDIVVDKNLYLECKTNWTRAAASKAYQQIDRAIKSKRTKIKYGYMVTFDGYFDIMSDGYDNRKNPLR